MLLVVVLCAQHLGPPEIGQWLEALFYDKAVRLFPALLVHVRAFFARWPPSFRGCSLTDPSSGPGPVVQTLGPHCQCFAISAARRAGVLDANRRVPTRLRWVVEILKYEFRRGLPLGRRRATSRKRSNGHLPHRTSYLDTRSEPQTTYRPQVCSRCIYLRTCSGYTFGKAPCIPQQGIGAIQTRGFLGVWCTQGHVRAAGHRGVRFPMAFIVCMRRSRKH